MKEYIEELVDHLRDSYTVSRKINFKLYIEPIELDVNPAISLGLIVNEAIINAFKYAFPEERSGAIHLSLRKKSETNYTLSIEDDGIGFPNEFIPSQNQSLGLTLIRGFSAQLDADLKIESKNGVKIFVQFIEESNQA